MAPLHILVSNQSFDIDPVDIDVYVDDVQLVTGDFLVEGQHTSVQFDFSAEADKPHTVRAVTKKGGVDKTQTVLVPRAGRWVAVDFWYYAPGNSYPEPTPPSLSIHDYEHAPLMD